jgi:glycosyltransferase involved in cell wall biosynthesis
MMGDRKRILHVITGLAMGGAEIMLYKLLQLHRDQFDCQVISLTGEGPVATKIQALGIPVRTLEMSRSFPGPFAVSRLAKWMRAAQPDLIQTWMYHADLVGGLAAWLAGGLPLVWGIHNTTLDANLTKTRTRLVVTMNARLSHWLPEQIISCSEKARELHIRKGYDRNKFTVIPNGFDLRDFKSDPDARVWLRSSLQLPPKTQMIGHVARFDPQKDYPNLLAAAAILRKTEPNVHFVLCGDGLSQDNDVLMDWVRSHQLQDRVHLLGRREDIARVMAAFDVGTLTSAYGEAFPNVVGEMMACEVPCVVTDVGDSDLMVGDTGKVVPPRTPTALAGAWAEFLHMPEPQRHEYGQAARDRIRKHFAIEEIAHRYANVYRSLLDQVTGTDESTEKEGQA